MSYIGNIPTTVAFLVDTFSGNGSTTAYTLSQAPANTSSILVAVSGVVQDPSTYSVSGTTLTFSAAPPSGSSNISVRFLGIPASGVATTAYRTVTNFTATAGQTTFTVPSYTVGYIDVYRNGVRLAAADYTATSGTTVVLATGATAGDSVVTESFFVSSVLNAIPAVANAVTDTYINTGAVTTTKIADANVTQAKLATGVGATGPAFSAYQTSGTSLSNGAYVKVLFQAEEFDTANCYDTSNSRFTPNVAGYYQFNYVLNLTGGTIFRTQLAIYKNGSKVKIVRDASATAGDIECGSAMIYANGTTDYFEFYAYCSGGAGTTWPGIADTYVQGFLARAA